MQCECLCLVLTSSAKISLITTKSAKKQQKKCVEAGMVEFVSSPCQRYYFLQVKLYAEQISLIKSFNETP